MFTSVELLDMAIRFERNGETVYRKAMEQIKNPELLAVLSWMADEEARHAERFSRLKAIQNDASENLIGGELQQQLMKQMIGEQSFSLSEVDFGSIESTEGLIRTFIEFERDTILFYEMIRPFIEEEEPKSQLEEIIEEENRHVAHLRRFLTQPEVVEN